MAAAAHAVRKKKAKDKDRQAVGRAITAFEHSHGHVEDIMRGVKIDEEGRVLLSAVRPALDEAYGRATSDEELADATRSLHHTSDDGKISAAELEAVVRSAVLGDVVHLAAGRWRKWSHAVAPAEAPVDGDSKEESYAPGTCGDVAAADAVAPPHEHEPPSLRDALRVWYDSERAQFFVAALILGNFLANALEAQLVTRASDGGDLNDSFHAVETFFMAIFIVELGVNLSAHAGRGFWRSSWNVFDVVVVAGSIVVAAAGPTAPPGLNELRLLRAFRVFRLFKRISSMRKILFALAESVQGVTIAFVILLLFHMLYAIVGVGLFRNFGTAQHVEDLGFEVEDIGQFYFGTFGAAMFTLFSVRVGPHNQPEPEGRKGGSAVKACVFSFSTSCMLFSRSRSHSHTHIRALPRSFADSPSLSFPLSLSLSLPFSRPLPLSCSLAV